MRKVKSAEDIISEEEFTVQMASASTQPEYDSPGDSETDLGSEFIMGIDYEPDEKNNREEVTEESDKPQSSHEMLYLQKKITLILKFQKQLQ
jgi:hypothetical protein